MRFLIAIFGTLLLVGGVTVAQDPPPPGGFTPAVRHNRNRPVLPPSVPSETPATQPNRAGFPAAPQQVGLAQLPATAQPIQGPAPAPTAPPTASNASPAPPSPGEAQAQLNLPPPTLPQVTYRDGQLTVQALNSTLGSVLTAIRNKTGIQFEGLDAAPERVVVAMGPAPEGEVLAAILSGSHFDYVAIDRPDSPGIVQRVILTPRAGGTAPIVAGGSPATNSSEEEEVADDDADSLRAPQDTPARPPIMQAQPLPPANPQPQPNPATTTIPTPEQLKEQILQMEQRKQQVQQPAVPQKVPQ
jgi:hypothetical protein